MRTDIIRRTADCCRDPVNPARCRGKCKRKKKKKSISYYGHWYIFTHCFHHPEIRIHRARTQWTRERVLCVCVCVYTRYTKGVLTGHYFHFFISWHFYQSVGIPFGPDSRETEKSGSGFACYFIWYTSIYTYARIYIHFFYIYI